MDNRRNRISFDSFTLFVELTWRGLLVWFWRNISASVIRISIPLDLSSRSFIPLSRFIRSPCPTTTTWNPFPSPFSYVLYLSGTCYVFIFSASSAFLFILVLAWLFFPRLSLFFILLQLNTQKEKRFWTCLHNTLAMCFQRTLSWASSPLPSHFRLVGGWIEIRHGNTKKGQNFFLESLFVRWLAYKVLSLLALQKKQIPTQRYHTLWD
jgi:hypothetical protein